MAPPRSFYQGRELQAGMPADVLIKTGERTVLGDLARPITEAMSIGFIAR